jgi:hypothetical protein
MSLKGSARLRFAVAISLVWPAIGCDRGNGGNTVLDEAGAGAAAASPVDSIVPMDIAIERFREGTTNPETLRNGETSRDRLVERFVASLAASDTTALVGLVLDRAEFAWLYYPTTPEAFPPYELPPDLAWFRLTQVNARGLGRALRELGGHADLRLDGYQCAPQPTVEGDNRIWTDCMTTVAYGGSPPVTVGLFGAIIQRGNQFKFLSYSNDF